MWPVENVAKNASVVAEFLMCSKALCKRTQQLKHCWPNNAGSYCLRLHVANFAKQLSTTCNRVRKGTYCVRLQGALHVASVCTPRCMLLRVVGSCCKNVEIGQTFEPTTRDISLLFHDR